MKLLRTFSSANGRNGTKLVSSSIDELYTNTPYKVSLNLIGVAEGYQVYRIEKHNEGKIIVIGDDLKPITGCTKIESIWYGSVLLCNQKGFAFKSYGYKRRKSNDYIFSLNNGELEQYDGDASVALALGCYGELQPKDCLEDAEIPAIDNQFADFFKSISK